MTAVQSVEPIYHDPTPAPTRSRRTSSRRSFASSLSRSRSYYSSPHAICPKDEDAFSYDADHLRAWYLPQETWDRLPAELRATLAAVQHAGAAVLTGFARLDKHTAALDHGRPCAKILNEELLVQLDDLPPPRFRTTSNASSVFYSDFSTPATTCSPASQSGCTSPIESSFSPSQALSPLSLVPVGPSAEKLDKRSRSRERSFSTPLQPHDAYYATELSHLRTEALPRLRHLGHKLDTDWYEAKRTSNIVTEDVNAFENWWAENKCTVVSLNEECKRLAHAAGLASTGMGWCAP